MSDKPADPPHPNPFDVYGENPTEDLPEITIPDEMMAPEPPDRVLLLSDLLNQNSQWLNELAQSGVEMKDAHSMISAMITQEFLETILRAVAGEEAVVEAAIRVHERIAISVGAAKSQVAKAKLVQGVSPSAMMGNGNRAQRRGH